MRTHRFISSALVVGALYAAAALAQSNASSPQTHAGHGKDDGLGRLIKLIVRSGDLTPAQQSQVREMVAADRLAMRDTIGQLHQAKKGLADLLLGPQNVQADTVTAQLAQIAQLRQQVAQRKASTVLAIRALLTPDQLAKAAAAKDQVGTRPHHQGAGDPSTGSGT